MGDRFPVTLSWPAVLAHGSRRQAGGGMTALRRRRAASWRLPVLDSGRSDPWHYDDGPALHGYEVAASHLLGHGLTPAPNRVALRAMWRCGGTAQRAAEAIAGAWGLAS